MSHVLLPSSQLLECGEVSGLFEQGGSGAVDEVAGIVNEIRAQAEQAASIIAERELAAAFKTPDALAGAILNNPVDSEEDTADSLSGPPSPSHSASQLQLRQSSTAEPEDESSSDPARLALTQATTRAECWEVFKTRVAHNLHLILSLSSAGGGVRARLRAYPSLHSQCYWDHFLDWSPDALVAVASLHLEQLSFALPSVDMAPPAASPVSSAPHATLNASDSGSDLTAAEASDALLRTSLSVAACNIYLTVPHACASYNALTRRQVFVTPKSYFEWMTAFSNTWNARRNRLVLLLDRLYNGIATIDSTNALVGTLRVQLADMQVRSTSETSIFFITFCIIRLAFPPAACACTEAGGGSKAS